MQKIPRTIVICGPSGSGKSTLLKLLFENYPAAFGFSVSRSLILTKDTTRKPRDGEKNGVQYHFSTREKILEMVKKGLFIEHAEFSGNLYGIDALIQGTSFAAVQDVLKENKNVILDIDMQGVIQLKEKLAKDKSLLGAKPLYIFLSPPSMQVLEQRLRARGTESEETLAPRLKAATAEMEWGNKSGNCDCIIVNHEIETSYKELVSCLKKNNILV